MKNNPFDITKAVDYTDDEIYRYWVDIKEHGFHNLIKPETLMPMIIVGSKGSGKTHIMKYFSYELQKITKPIDTGLKKDKFIGVYIRCSGFNADKFSGKGVSADIWATLYAYYWELWIGERITSILVDLQKNNVIADFNESDFINEVLKLFSKQKKKIKTLTELSDYFLHLQKNVEYEIQNFIFQGKQTPVVEILLPIAKLSYEYPALLKEKIPFFKDKYILYLIDELENFSASQQQLIQTLLREKPAACTFRVGTRPYGIRTYKTLGEVEENHDGSEFEKIILDDFLRELKEEDYEKYITEICERRLQNSNFILYKDFKIEEFIEDQTNEDTIAKVYKKKETQSRSYMHRLRKNLENLKNIHLLEKDIDTIINNITFINDYIIERTNVVLIYRRIKNKSTRLVQDSKEIKKSANLYYDTKSTETEHFKYLNKYKQDIIDAIAREGRVDIPYYGFKKLVKLSCGTPRVILRLLKAAFNTQYFESGKTPFVENRKLTVKSQKAAIETTYNWFFEENRIPSSSQNRAIDAVVRLGNYLQSLRFTDLPPQCSINIFSIPKESMSEKAREVFELLERYSYFVKTDERRVKNTNNKNSVYMLNSILIPKWELSLAKRGLVTLSLDDAEIIFNPDKHLDYKDYINKKIKQYTYPFNQQETLADFQGLTLF